MERHAVSRHGIPGLSSSFYNRCYNCNTDYVQRSELVAHLRRSYDAELGRCRSSQVRPRAASSSTRKNPDEVFRADLPTAGLVLFRTDFDYSALLDTEDPDLRRPVREVIADILARATPSNDEQFMSALAEIRAFESWRMREFGFPVDYGSGCRELISEARGSLLSWLRIMVEDVGLLFARRSVGYNSLWNFVHGEGLKEEVRLVHDMMVKLAQHLMVLAKKQNNSHEFSNLTYYGMMDSRRILEAEPCWVSFGKMSTPHVFNIADHGPDACLKPGSEDDESGLPNQSEDAARVPVNSLADIQSVGREDGAASSDRYPPHDSHGQSHVGSQGAQLKNTFDGSADGVVLANQHDMGNDDSDQGSATDDLSPVTAPFTTHMPQDTLSRGSPQADPHISYCNYGSMRADSGESWTSSALRWANAKATGFDVLIRRISVPHCDPPSPSCAVCNDRRELLRGVCESYPEGGKWVCKTYMQ